MIIFRAKKCKAQRRHLSAIFSPFKIEERKKKSQQVERKKHTQQWRPYTGKKLWIYKKISFSNPPFERASPPTTTSSRTYTQGGHDATFHTQHTRQSLSLRVHCPTTTQQQLSSRVLTQTFAPRFGFFVTSFPSFQVLGSLK